MKSRATITLVLIVAALLLLPLTAAAGTTTRFEGKTVVAAFSTVDASGCVVTDTFVFASAVRFTSNKPKSGDEFSAADVHISRFDFCTETLLSSASGSAIVDATELQVASKLTSAALTTTVEMFDFVTGDAFTVEVDLDWVGIDECGQQKGKFTFTAPGFKITEHFNSTFCRATATGEIMNGATNYASEPSIFAEISSARSGMLVVEK